MLEEEVNQIQPFSLTLTRPFEAIPRKTENSFWYILK
jgi:hypothetical protein